MPHYDTIKMLFKIDYKHFSINMHLGFLCCKQKCITFSVDKGSSKI